MGLIDAQMPTHGCEKQVQGPLSTSLKVQIWHNLRESNGTQRKLRKRSRIVRRQILRGKYTERKRDKLTGFSGMTDSWIRRGYHRNRLSDRTEKFGGVRHFHSTGSGSEGPFLPSKAPPPTNPQWIQNGSFGPTKRIYLRSNDNYFMLKEKRGNHRRFALPYSSGSSMFSNI